MDEEKTGGTNKWIVSEHKYR